MKSTLFLFFIFSLLSFNLQAQFPSRCKNIKSVNVEDISAEEINSWLEKIQKCQFGPQGLFTFHGEVDAKWKNVHEKLGGIKQVGQDSVSGKPENQYKIEAILLLNYEFDRTWAAIKLDFDNETGQNSGNVNSIALKRAVIGYHFLPKSTPYVFDVNLGRNSLTDLYYSEVEFDSVGDGATLIFGVDFDNFVDFIAKGGIYLEDANKSHPFWIVDAGFYNIGYIGIYIDYNLIDWTKVSLSGSRNDPKYKFTISQLSLGWSDFPKLFGKPIKVFSGFLLNHSAIDRHWTNNRKQNFAFFAGLQFGKVIKKYDFAFKAQWQSVQAQAVPDFDLSGIGRGNAVKGTLYGSGSSALANGNTNYQGFELGVQFGVTDHIVLKPKFQRAVTLNNSIGSPLSYTRFSLDTSYTW